MKPPSPRVRLVLSLIGMPLSLFAFFAELSLENRSFLAAMFNGALFAYWVVVYNGAIKDSAK